MKVVHLVEELGIGGLPNYVLQLARLSQSSVDEVRVAHMGESVGRNLETEGLDIVKISRAADLAAYKPDIVHVHLLSRLECLRDLFSLGAPLVRFFHDYTSTCLRRGKRRWPGDRCQRPLNAACAGFGCVIGRPAPGSYMPRLMDLSAKMEEMALFQKFDALITGSRHMTNMLLKNKFDPARVHTVPYFSSFSNDARTLTAKTPGAGVTRPVEILFSGQAVKGKGLEILIEALGSLRGGWRLTVFSEGPRLPAAKELAARAGISGRIAFRGWVSQSALKDAYRQADIFALPSIWDDPGPLVGIEAMSFATPVVGFAVGGIPDYVIDGITGRLVTDVSARGMHAALQSCLDAPGKLEALGQNAQQQVRERHMLAQHLDGVMDIYKKILRENGRKQCAAS